MSYVIFDKVTEQYLKKFNLEFPLKSKWEADMGDSVIYGKPALFERPRDAKGVLKVLNKHWKDEPGGLDFVIVKVKLVVVYEFISNF